jgi:hypothetical protein
MSERGGKMGRRIIEAYVAAVCFSATLLILISAPHFFRARHAKLLDEGESPAVAGGYREAESNHDRDRYFKEMLRGRENLLDYESQRESLMLNCAVLAGHLVLLAAAEVIFRRRSLAATTAPEE